MQNNETVENQVKEVIISSLNLEDFSVEDIETEAPLFNEGLGLDSIDALELGIAIKKEFEIELDVESDIKGHFFSVATLTKFILDQKK